MADITTPEASGVETAEGRRQKQIEEYGTYVCDSEDGISINGSLAFNKGDPVPVSHVEAFPDLLNQGLVKKTEKPKAEKPKAPPGS